MIAKDTQTKGGFPTLLTYKEYLSSVTSFMTLKESEVGMAFPESFHLNGFSPYS
jgi:hypothetical protein